MAVAEPHPPHVVLIGFSGSGKSTIGPMLAKSLRRRFIDSDAEITRRTGRSIRSIFADEGEGHFRSLEQHVVLSLIDCSTPPSVLALGGGAFETTEIRRRCLTECRVVYLRCAQEELRRRLSRQTDRPLLGLYAATRQRIREMMARRRKNYEMAHIIVSSSRESAVDLARVIAERLRRDGCND